MPRLFSSFDLSGRIIWTRHYSWQPISLAVRSMDDNRRGYSIEWRVWMSFRSLFGEYCHGNRIRRWTCWSMYNFPLSLSKSRSATSFHGSGHAENDRGNATFFWGASSFLYYVMSSAMFFSLSQLPSLSLQQSFIALNIPSTLSLGSPFSRFLSYPQSPPLSLRFPPKFHHQQSKQLQSAWEGFSN